MRKRLHRFDAWAWTGSLGERPRAGREPRLTEEKRSRIIALLSKDLPGKLITEQPGTLRTDDEVGAAYRSLDTLAEAAQEMGIEVGRGRVRRILLRVSKGSST